MARNGRPPRHKRARDDATIGSIERDIEKTYGLPEGSVNIKLPNGRNARSDKRVRKLRKDYKE